ncbi:hypothetical protein [Pleurocapsa sp. FMAR1]|uniref:hypothetical protein n=1 Tax=Pleurocapsa sp. FMAR1 TaxID=3040204 RepID=UPI0029C67DDE|nr:hypothetical protein [Pleurocapsa sp. FMAR1]
MSALRQPDLTTEYYSPELQPKNNNHQYQVVKRPQVKRAKVVKSRNFSQSNVLPNNLKTLSSLQKGSFGLALVSMTASIGLYISTVQIPELWSQEYQNLENLQLQERQLVSINETIKYQIAKEAGQNKQLAISTPESALFINPAEVQVKTASQINVNRVKVANLKLNSWGY